MNFGKIVVALGLMITFVFLITLIPQTHDVIGRAFPMACVEGKFSVDDFSRCVEESLGVFVCPPTETVRKCVVDDSGIASLVACSGSDCSSTDVLSATLCGNGVVDIDEQCDDGNQIDGDGCNGLCTTEVVSAEDILFDSGLFLSDMPGPNDPTPKDGYFEFDGTDDFINLPELVDDLSTLEEGSFSVWFRGTPPATRTPLLNYGSSGSNDRVVLEATPSGSIQLIVRVSRLNGVQLSSPNALDGQWHYVVVTQDGTQALLYLDGVDTTSLFSESNSGDWFDDVPPGHLYIGHEERLNADSYFNGDIGSVQIFTVPLTATAVDVLYAKELPTYIYCGDGEQNGNEQCDDGNQIEGDGCSAQCTLGLTAE